MKFEPMKPAPPVTSIFLNLRIFDVIPLTSYREIIEILDALYNKHLLPASKQRLVTTQQMVMFLLFNWPIDDDSVENPGCEYRQPPLHKISLTC